MIIIRDGNLYNIAQLYVALDLSDKSIGKFTTEVEVLDFFLSDGIYHVESALTCGEKGEIASALYDSKSFTVKCDIPCYAPTLINSYTIKSIRV